MKPLVYLAGAIAGLEYGEATDWRLLAKHRLAERGIEALSPMRAKDALGARNDGRISTNFQDYANLGAFFTSRGIMTRDCNDVRRCDALLVNVLDLPADRPSYGTVMELGWAYLLNKPAVVAIEDWHVFDRHPMISETMPFRASTLDEAIDLVAVLLNR